MNDTPMNDTPTPDDDEPGNPQTPDTQAPNTSSTDPQLPDLDSAPMTAAGKVDKDQIVQFVTTIKNAEQQVGENIIAALQHDDTVAVLTTVVIGPDGLQRVVSAALDQERMAEVNKILQAAQQERQDEEPCVGFHCLVKPKSPES